MVQTWKALFTSIYKNQKNLAQKITLPFRYKFKTKAKYLNKKKIKRTSRINKNYTANILTNQHG